jgi:hypothetical protein
MLFLCSPLKYVKKWKYNFTHLILEIDGVRDIFIPYVTPGERALMPIV